MRDIALLVVFIPMLLGGVRQVHAAVMVWIWTALAAPNSFLFGVLQQAPLNKIAAGISVFALVADRTRQRFLVDATFVFHTLFIVQGAVTLAFSLTEIPRSFDLYDKMVKIWLLVCVMRTANRERLQIHSILIMLTLSLGLHGILEGTKYIWTLGSHKVIATVTLGDNNSFAMAMLMMLPFFIYLYRYSKTGTVRIGFAVSGVLVLLGVMASASRGAVIGLMVLALMILMQNRRKLLGLFVLAVAGIAVACFAPTQWLDRMDTILRASEDSSFMGRVASWKMHMIVALNRPLTGGGFSSLEDPAVYRQFVGEFGLLDFIPSTPPVGVLAAHSIYFEVLGDTGVIGLFLFLGFLIAWFATLRQIKRTTRGSPSLAWAHDLATAFERSLIVYGISGAALSAAYFENVYIEGTLAGMLAACVRAIINARPGLAAPGMMRPGNGNGGAVPASASAGSAGLRPSEAIPPHVIRPWGTVQPERSWSWGQV